jgi:hypothetical protein
MQLRTNSAILSVLVLLTTAGCATDSTDPAAALPASAGSAGKGNIAGAAGNVAAADNGGAGGVASDHNHAGEISATAGAVGATH